MPRIRRYSNSESCSRRIPRRFVEQVLHFAGVMDELDGEFSIKASVFHKGSVAQVVIYTPDQILLESDGGETQTLEFDAEDEEETGEEAPIDEGQPASETDLPHPPELTPTDAAPPPDTVEVVASEPAEEVAAAAPEPATDPSESSNEWGDDEYVEPPFGGYGYAFWQPEPFTEFPDSSFEAELDTQAELTAADHPATNTNFTETAPAPEAAADLWDDATLGGGFSFPTTTAQPLEPHTEARPRFWGGWVATTDTTSIPFIPIKSQRQEPLPEPAAVEAATRLDNHLEAPPEPQGYIYIETAPPIEPAQWSAMLPPPVAEPPQALPPSEPLPVEEEAAIEVEAPILPAFPVVIPIEIDETPIVVAAPIPVAIAPVLPPEPEPVPVAVTPIDIPIEEVAPEPATEVTATAQPDPKHAEELQRFAEAVFTAWRKLAMQRQPYFWGVPILLEDIFNESFRHELAFSFLSRLKQIEGIPTSWGCSVIFIAEGDPLYQEGEPVYPVGQAQISRITFYRPGELPGVVLESAPESRPELRECVVPVPSRPVTCEEGEDCSKCLALAGHLQREADADEGEHRPYNHPQANWLQRLLRL